MKKGILLIAITMLAFSCKTEKKEAQDLAENQKPEDYGNTFCLGSSKLIFSVNGSF